MMLCFVCSAIGIDMAFVIINELKSQIGPILIETVHYIARYIATEPC